jgi:hypothetical protein
MIEVLRGESSHATGGGRGLSGSYRRNFSACARTI